MASRESAVVDEEEHSITTFADRQAALFAQGFSFSGFERDLVALNLGTGRFLDISGISGADSVSDGRGAAFADFDNDGDYDIFLTAMHGDAHLLFRNAIGSHHGFVRITLQGTRSGRDAFGTEVRLRTSAGTLTKVKSGGSGFISQSDARLLFGLGADPRAQSLEITWPSGLQQSFPPPEAGDSWLIIEGQSAPVAVEEHTFTLAGPAAAEDRRRHELGLVIGRPLVDVAVRVSDGTTRRLSDVVAGYDRLVLNLWATWCRSCAAEAPMIEALHRKRSPGTLVIGLSIDDETTRPRIPAFVERLGLTYPIVTIDQEDLRQLVRTERLALPTTIITDGSLKLEAVILDPGDIEG